MPASTPRSSDSLSPGQRIGPYLLLAPLGSGGSSRVWAVARTGQLGFTKRMALKVMRQDKLTSERARQRFDREARLGAHLRHANLRAVHELGSHEGRPHMALAWVDTSLEELLEHAPGKRLEPEVACWFGIQACAALAAAHAHVSPAGEPCPIVHGDVSPGNVLLTMNGHVLLADLAAAADASPGSAVRQRAESKAFFGSLGYAAPESLKGEAVDGRADLFALGCVPYEALCGVRAFAADDEHSLVFQVLERGPVDLAQRAPELPEPLLGVVRRALQRSLEARFSSADEMRKALCSCVPMLTPFELEQRSADFIGRVLGECIQQREEQMRLTYQRFAALQLERTDTLPIGNAAQRRESGTLRAGVRAEPLSAPPVAGSSDPGKLVADARSMRDRRAFWLVVAVAAVATGLYAARPEALEPTAANPQHQVTPPRPPEAAAPLRWQHPPRPREAERAAAPEPAPTEEPGGPASRPPIPAPNPLSELKADSPSGAKRRSSIRRAEPATPDQRARTAPTSRAGRKYQLPSAYQDVDGSEPSAVKSVPTP